MFYDDSACAYKILGIYHVHRKNPRNILNNPRDFIGLAYRIRGCSTFTFGAQELQAEDHSIIYLPNGVTFRNKTDGPEELIILHLQPFGNADPEPGVIPDCQNLEPMFRKLLSAWEAGGYHKAMSELYSILDSLQQTEQPKNRIPPVIEPGVAMIQQQFRDPKLTVSQAANACFVSEVYFRRLYKSHFGTSPLQDILNLRFDYALGLLRSGYYSVEQVARQSGFSDVKYFRTAFTHHYGMTPTAYGKKSGKNH